MTNANKIYSNADNKNIQINEMKEGDIIAFDTNRVTKGLNMDHIGIIKYDKINGKLIPYIIESSSSHNGFTKIKLDDRLNELKKKFPDMKYKIARFNNKQ